MSKHCPHCGSTNLKYTSSRVYGCFVCRNCGGWFDESEDDRDDYECPSCGSSNTAYYNNSSKHHYCYDCETRW